MRACVLTSIHLILEFNCTGIKQCFSYTDSLNLFHWHRGNYMISLVSLKQLWYAALTLSQCTLARPVYTGMPLECYWLTHCTLGYHWATQRILAGYTETPLEKLSCNSPTLECHWRNLVKTAPHWDATGGTLTFAAYTGTPLEELWQPTHAPTHKVKHAE